MSPLFLAVCSYYFFSRNFIALGICFGAYVAFLGIHYLVCRLSVPQEHRERPPRPAGFRGLSPGKITPGWARILDASTMRESMKYKGVRHELFYQEQDFLQGTWRLEVEVAGEKVVAWRRSFESAESTILDCHKQAGAGVFLRSFGD